MKVFNTLIICLAATLATSKAQVIYDDFSGPAGPLASSPSASLWTVQASPADTASLDGSGNLLQTGGNGSELRSTTSFNMTEVSGMQFKSHVYGGFFGGVAMVYGGSGSIRGLYLRNDLGNGLQFWVYDDNGARSGASFTPAATGALWTLSYNPATSTASAYQNGSLVSSLSGITITATTAQFSMFQYGPWYINTSYQYVATTLPVYWAPSAGGGGTGTWSAANTNWASIAGIQGDRVQSSTGTLVFGNTSGTVTVTTNVNVAAGMTFSTDAYTLTSGTVTLTGASAASNTITTAASVGTTLASQLAGSNGMTKAGAGTLILSGNNTYSGSTLISGGTLRIGAGGTSGTLGTGNVTNNGGTLIFNRSDAITVANIISGGGPLTQAGSGTLTLTASNTYTGATAVEQGTLVVDGSLASSQVTVNDAATLAGSGTLGAATILSGGTISPGNSPGTLTLTNDLTWNGGGNYNWQIFGLTGTAGQTNTWDLIDVTGGTWDISGLSSTNKFNINLWSLGTLPDTTGAVAGFDATQTYSWKILASVGLSTNSIFNAAHFNINTSAINGTGGFVGATGLFSLELDDNNDLFLNYTGAGAAVPEPGTWAAGRLLSILAAAAAARRRRQMKCRSTDDSPNHAG